MVLQGLSVRGGRKGESACGQGSGLRGPSHKGKSWERQNLAGAFQVRTWSYLGAQLLRHISYLGCHFPPLPRQHPKLSRAGNIPVPGQLKTEELECAPRLAIPQPRTFSAKSQPVSLWVLQKFIKPGNLTKQWSRSDFKTMFSDSKVCWFPTSAEWKITVPVLISNTTP